MKTLSPLFRWMAYLLNGSGDTKRNFRRLWLPFAAVFVLLVAFALFSAWRYSHEFTVEHNLSDLLFDGRWSVLFTGPRIWDMLLFLGMIFMAILGVAKIHPHDPESFWRTRPVTFPQMFSAWAILLAAFGVFWCWLFPIALALVMELPFSAALHWCAIRTLIFVFVIPFLLAAVPYPFREGDIGRRLLWAAPPLGTYLLSVLGFFDTDIQLPGEFLPWGSALVTALFALSALAIAARVFLLRKNTFALVFAGSVWGVAAAGAIGIAWKSEVLFANQEKSLPECPLAITLEKAPKTDTYNRDFEEKHALQLPLQKNEDGTVWIYLGEKSLLHDKSERVVSRERRLDSWALLPNAILAMGLKPSTLESVEAKDIYLSWKAIEVRVYFEQFRLVKLSEFPRVDDGLHKSKDGVLFARELSRPFGFLEREVTHWGPFARDDSEAALQFIHVNSHAPALVMYWEPKTKKVLNVTWLDSSTGSSWVGLLHGQQGINPISEKAPEYGFPETGSMVSVFSLESTGKRAVKTFVRENEKENWREKK